MYAVVLVRLLCALLLSRWRPLYAIFSRILEMPRSDQVSIVGITGSIRIDIYILPIFCVSPVTAGSIYRYTVIPRHADFSIDFVRFPFKIVALICSPFPLSSSIN